MRNSIKNENENKWKRKDIKKIKRNKNLGMENFNSKKTIILLDF